MKTFKRILSCLLVLAMLGSMTVMTSAEEAAVSMIGKEILNSITVEEDTGLGLAFLVKMNVKGAAINARKEFVNANATATFNGEEYNVVKMGAIMANQAENIANIDKLTLNDVTGEYILNIEAKYLFDVQDEYCQFAVRIINLPPEALGRGIACRPYIVLEKGGEEIVVYADADGTDISTYNSNYYASAPEETPVLDVDKLSAVITKNRLKVTAAVAEYADYDPATYVEAFKVTLTLENISANAKTSVGDSIAYVCKDTDGNALATVDVKIDELQAGETKDVTFYAPIGTATITKASATLNYTPDIVMPAIGSDIDVSKKKNRIRVSATEASFNTDGTIHVVWTFTNYTSNWITEETDYIKYKYYKDTTAKGTATLYIGVIDTKKNPVKTFEFDVPSYTTEVRITSSKIVYWTEWA